MLGKLLRAEADKAANQVIDNAGPIIKVFFPEILDKKEGRDFFVKAVAESDEYTIAEKTLMISEEKRIVRQLRNKIKIAALADKLISEKGCSESTCCKNINEDIEWFERYFDQAKFIDKPEKQISWASILAQKAIGDNDVPIAVIRIMLEITESQAQAFAKVCSHKVQLLHFDSENNFVEKQDLIFVPYMDKHNKF